jgi:hypothetical protein
MIEELIKKSAIFIKWTQAAHLSTKSFFIDEDWELCGNSGCVN